MRPARMAGSATNTTITSKIAASSIAPVPTLYCGGTGTPSDAPSSASRAGAITATKTNPTIAPSSDQANDAKNEQENGRQLRIGGECTAIAQPIVVPEFFLLRTLGLQALQDSSSC